MLACARIGAPHSVVFGGFSAEAVKDRINDCEAKVLVTADFSLRRGKPLPMKESIDAVLADCPSIEHVRRRAAHRRRRPVDRGPRRLVARGGRGGLARLPGGAVRRRADALPALHVGHHREAEGHRAHERRLPDRRRPRRTTWCSTSSPTRDVYWCSADIGWVTGHSYIVYGPLANGCTSILYEGAPDYPDKDRWWEIVERYRCTVFYTAPTAIRACIKWGREYPDRHDLSLAAPARQRRRADQPARLALVPRGDRRRALPDRRHLVADRDRPHHDHAAAGHHAHEAGLGDRPVPGHRGRDLRLAGQRGRGGRRHPGPEAAVAGHVPHALQGARALRRDLLVASTGPRSTWSATPPAATRTATSGSWAAPTT